MIPAESFIRSSLFTVSAALLGKFLNFLGSILIAAHFGADGRTDVIFFVFLLLQSLLPFFTDFNQNVLLPDFINLNQAGKYQEAGAMVRFFLLFFGGITCLLVFVLFFTIDDLLRVFTDFPVDLRRESRVGILLLLPLLFLNYVNDLIINVYQAHKNYSLSNVATFLQGICLVAAILLWAEYGTVAIALGFLGGALLQFFYACILLKRHAAWPLFLGRGSLNLCGLRAFVPLILLFPLTGLIYNFAPVYLSSHLESGTLTAINFARRLYLFIPTLFIYPLVLVLYPRLCERAVSNRQGLSASLVDFHNLLLLFVMPMAAFFCMFAPEITRLSFSYGRYSTEALDISSRSLRFLAPGAVMLVLSSITGRAVFSTRNFRITFINLLVNIIGAVIFPFFLYLLLQNYGYIGIVFGCTVFLFVFHGLTNWVFIYFFIGSFNIFRVLGGYVQNLVFSLSGLCPVILCWQYYRYEGYFFAIISFLWLLSFQFLLHGLFRTRAWEMIKSHLRPFRFSEK